MHRKRCKECKIKSGIGLSSCGSKFVGRRNGRGGYVYFDSRQSRSFDIAGSNPTSDEWAFDDKAYNQHLADVAKNDEIQRAKLAEQQRQQYAEYQRAVTAEAEQQRRQQQAQAALDMRRQTAGGGIPPHRPCRFRKGPQAENYFCFFAREATAMPAARRRQTALRSPVWDIRRGVIRRASSS
jgi:hypothetical protein